MEFEGVARLSIAEVLSLSAHFENFFLFYQTDDLIIWVWVAVLCLGEELARAQPAGLARGGWAHPLGGFYHFYKKL